MIRSRRAAGCLASFLVVCSCGEETDRPPPAADCVEDCGPGAPAGPAGGAQQEPPSPAPLPPPSLDAGTESGLLSGGVLVLEEDFVTATPFSGEGDIGTDGVAGRITEPFIGDVYEIAGVLRAPRLWVDVTPAPGVHDLLPTLQPVTRGEPPVDLFLVRADVLDTFAVQLQDAQDILPDRAQVVLRFVRGTVGVSGVRITQHNAEVAAYDAGGIYSDIVESTEVRGIVILYNMQAAPFPGGITAVSFAAPREDGSPDLAPGTVDVKVAQGAASVVTVAL